MFKHLKIGSRLSLGFAMVLAFMLATIATGMNGIREMNEETEAIVRYENLRTELVNDMVDATQAMGIVVGDISLAKYRREPDSAVNGLREQFAERRSDYATAVAEIRKLITSQDTLGSRLFAKVEATGISAQRLQDQVIERSLATKDDPATTQLSRRAASLSQLWIEQTDTLVKNEDHRTLMRFEQTERVYARTRTTLLVLGGLGIAISLAIIVFLTVGITRPLRLSIQAADRIAEGDLSIDLSGAGDRSDEIGELIKSFTAMIAALSDAARQAEVVSRGDYSAEFSPRSPKDNLGMALLRMTEVLRQNQVSVRSQDWLKTGVARLNEVMAGNPELSTLATKVISEFTTYLGAQVGVLYVAQDGDATTLAMLGSYAHQKRKSLANSFRLGEGLVGQAALEKSRILLSNVPDDYIQIGSGLGERVPRFICVSPFLHENRVKGVVEVGAFAEPTDLQLQYLDQAMPLLALAVESAEGRSKLARSLEESQTMTEQLQAQQEELRATNEELEEQTRALRLSEEKLKVQQEELQVTNEELEEKNQLLDLQKRDVEKARKDIEAKAKELSLASKYKSEFLANMSHELRTPLNSLLLLAQSLSENRAGNLDSEQVQSAKIILGSGGDLLGLINEILDLSKVEAGRMDLQLTEVAIDEMAESVRNSFLHMAREKGLELSVSIDPAAPRGLVSDRKRIEQVVRNLVSNAIKFTDSGSISVAFGPPRPGTALAKPELSANSCLAISVLDTGIGIAPENQRIIFEAFQQVDGGTARKYGGTGLGLSISREMANLLGGEIQMESRIGQGSCFTLFLPVAPSGEQPLATPRGPAIATKGRETPSKEPKRIASSPVDDDRKELQEEDRSILVIEDDPHFARILVGKCHEKGFKCLTASNGESGLELAARHHPQAILLDIGLPGMDGWAVLAALKENPRTRHIPVHIASAEDATTDALRKGAVGQSTKPLSQGDLDTAFAKLLQASSEKPHRVLVVDDDILIRRETTRLISDRNIEVVEVETGIQAQEALRTGGFDCVILDLALPDMNGAELLRRLGAEGVQVPPVIVHTARDLTQEEENGLREHAESIVIKDVRSQERLLDEVALFLHQVVGQMPEAKRKMITDLHDTDTLLRGKLVLIVDDDMRTTFALSHHLSERGVRTLKAENGERAIKLLDENPDIDMVLMDIMMPVVDGYQAMARIRSDDRFRKLPILALTAKAMPEDREKCLAAGANDYLQKPVDPQRLVSMMRVWLYR